MKIEGKQFYYSISCSFGKSSSHARMVDKVIKMVEVTKLGCKIHTLKKNTEHYHSAFEPILWRLTQAFSMRKHRVSRFES